MEEIWKPIIGGLYQVSNLGRVKSASHHSHDGRFWHGRVLKTFVINGYHFFCISIDGRRKNLRLHPLVANAFIGRRPKHKEINHIDTNRDNNKASNLEYVTRKRNMELASIAGLMPTKKNGRWRRKWHP
jgi:hypothetical protein